MSPSDFGLRFVEICLAAHFGRGGTTYAGLLARPGLLARLVRRPAPVYWPVSAYWPRVYWPVHVYGRVYWPVHVYGPRVYWPAPVYWPDRPVGHGPLESTEPTHLGLLAVSVGRLPSGAPSLTDAPVGRVLRCGCHTLQQIET
jgi:hypothetical protein